jgi:hypothetical protein
VILSENMNENSAEISMLPIRLCSGPHSSPVCVERKWPAGAR